ncbi:hypothetical protein L1987_36041 [Smallanthus sonchifolius]|uniref:Uncharacterized protein n=1 Tax=Smallanthus sonchifolius TaxID=185202 RepID=A0ACB9HET0_9ASTR|nr:hypothetical protein L1987_36041 [Smallanthus sonchifolius]
MFGVEAKDMISGSGKSGGWRCNRQLGLFLVLTVKENPVNSVSRRRRRSLTTGSSRFSRGTFDLSEQQKVFCNICK